MVVGCTRPYGHRQAKGCGRVTSLNEKIQTARYLSRNAGSLWAKRILRNLPPERSLALIHELERQGMAVELNLEIPSWRTDQIVTKSVLLEPASTILIPPAAPLEEDAHGWHPYRARELQGVTLDVDSGLAFAGEQVIAQSGSGTRASRDAAFVSGATARVRKTKPIVVNGPIAPLGDVHHHYHVMLESLPRMLHARALNPEVRFITTSEVADRYSELFEELELRIEQHQPGSVLLGHPLVLVDQPDLFWPRKADISALGHALGDTAHQPTKLLYFPRGSTFRRPDDEDRLQDSVVAAGFQIIELDRYSLREQWLLAQESMLIAGPHGAALWTVGGMKEGATLIELSSGECYEACYRRVAALNDVAYQFASIKGSSSKPFGSALDAECLLAKAAAQTNE